MKTMNKEKLPTAEEILHKHFKPLDPFDNICILSAMSVHSAPLQTRIEELEKELQLVSDSEKDANKELGKMILSNKRLREALELISNIDYSNCIAPSINGETAVDIAKEALKPK